MPVNTAKSRSSRDRRRRFVCTYFASMSAALSAAAFAQSAPASPVDIVGEPQLFARGVASTAYADIRLTLSPDGNHALWFSRDRPGGAGSYDIWQSRRTASGWSSAGPVSFNSAARDFDPAFSADGRFVYFCSDHPGGLGGSDLYRVAVNAGGFGTPEHLGAAVNSSTDEFAPMPSPDDRQLLFSSDRAGGAGGHDLYIAARHGAGFAAATPLPGVLNTPAHEFDATLLSDGTTLVFARARDFDKARVDLLAAAAANGRYDAGTALPRVNDATGDTYGAMLDWSQRDRLLYAARRDPSRNMDLYLVRYRLHAPVRASPRN